MKKYHKYGHHKKKKWNSCTLQFIIDFTAKHQKPNTQVNIYLAPGKYTEDIVIHNSDRVGLDGIVEQSSSENCQPIYKVKQWPPVIRQFSNDFWHCKICKTEDHSGLKNQLCRCQSRNIRVAKERRKNGLGVWTNNQSKE